MLSKSQLSLHSGNTLQNQAYMDYYKVDYGNAPLTSVVFSNLISLPEVNHNHYSMGLELNYIDRVNTYNIGLAINDHNPYFYNLIHGLFLALDLSKYNNMYFKQAVAGGKLSAYGYGVDINLYLPIGGGSFDKMSNSGTIYPMLGIDMSVSKRIEALTASITGSFFTRDNIDSDISAVRFNAAYDFNKQLTLGARYEKINRPGGEDIGYAGFIRINLLENPVDTEEGGYVPTDYAVQRMLGPLLQSDNS